MFASAPTIMAAAISLAPAQRSLFIPRISLQYFLTIALNNDKIVNRNKRIIAARTRCLCGCVHRVSPTGNTAFLQYSIRLFLA